MEATSNPCPVPVSDVKDAGSKRAPSAASGLAVLESANLEELRHEWRRLHCSEPPRVSRDLLIRGIGYRIPLSDFPQSNS